MRVPGFDDVSIDDLRRRRTLKWDLYGDDVIAAWVADMDFATAPVIREALLAVLDRDGLGYPQLEWSSGVGEACAGWLAAHLGWSVDPERIHTVPDVVKGIALALDTFSRPGSPVVLLTPAYPPFFEVVGMARRQLIEVPPRLDGDRPTLDLDRIDAVLGEGARTIVLCNPHNPLGRVYGKAELASLAEVVERHGARVVSDEVHAPLVYPGHVHVPYATVASSAIEHSVTLTSASKAWNLAGLKCAQLILTSDADVARWRQMPFAAYQGATPLGLAAAVAAFTDGEPWRGQLMAYLDANRRFLDEVVADRLPKIGCRPPEATYLAWLDCRELGVEDPAAFFVQRAKVALSDGRMFGAAGEGFVRLNFATSREILTRILDAMSSALTS